MEVKVFPIENGEFTLWEDEGDTAEDLDENWASTKMEVIKGEQDMFVIRKAEGNLSVIPEKQAALTTFGFTISLHFLANFLAHLLASPAKPPIEAPMPVGIIKAPVFICKLYYKFCILVYNIAKYSLVV